MKSPNRHFLSIKLKMIIAYAVIVILTILLFSAVLTLNSEKLISRLAEKNAEQTVLISLQALNTKIYTVNSYMMSFQTDKEVSDILCGYGSGSTQKDVSRLENILLNIDKFHDNISNIELYVLNHSEYPQYGAPGTVFSSDRLQNDPWFKKALAAGNSVNWSVRNTLDESNSFIVASKVLTDVTNGTPTAVLKAYIDIHDFTGVIENISIMDTGKIFLCSENNIIDYSKSQLGISLANNNTLFNDMLKTSSTETRSIRLNGDAYIISSHPISDTGIFLVSATRVAEFQSNRLFPSIIITGLLLILVSFVFVWFVAHSITKPLSALANILKRYDPDSEDIIDITSNDEIGILQLHFNNLHLRIKKLIGDIKNEMSVRKRAELKALQAQITPHFLYNTLNSISLLAKKYQADDIRQMIVALSRFFMVSLSNGAEVITIEQELQHINSYIYIQKIRYDNSFEFRTDIDEGLMNNLICKLTIQPLVENCLTHAFADTDKAGIITLSIKQNGTDIVIRVSDNGKRRVDIDELNRFVRQGFDLNEPIEKYGIHNINQRIKLYFGEEYGLSYEKNIPQGLTAVVRIKSMTKGNEQ